MIKIKTKSHDLSVIGKSVTVRDAREKVTGSLEYAIDFSIPNMVFGKIIRSPHPHAKVRNIDTSLAEALPGFLGIVTHHDAPNWDWQSCWFNYQGKIMDEWVRFVGDEVAAVAAIDEETAARAARMVKIDYELLPAVFDPEEALKKDAPQVRSEGNARQLKVVEWGDVEQGFKDSEVVVESSMTFGSQSHAPLGRNACIARWISDKVTLWTSTQTPAECQTAVAQAFGIPVSSVRAIALPSGCSFGLWWINNFHMITVLLARKIRRPVKIELTQEECFLGVKRRHLERSKGRIGCSKDGRIIAIEVHHLIDNGGYGFKPDVGFLCVDLWGRGPHGKFTVQPVSTNLLTAGCMRGVGDVTLGSFTERLLDMAAIKLDIDPLTFRLKNHLRSGEPLRKVPKDYAEYRARFNPGDDWPLPNTLASEAIHECLEKGAEAFGWKERWKGWGIPCRVEGSKRWAVGVGTGSHCCGVQQEGNTSAIVKVHVDGSATLLCSIGRQGQSGDTTQAQIVAETLGIPLSRVEVVAGDSDASPWSHGSIASNTTFRTGYATLVASLDAKTQILEIAGKFYLKRNPDDLDIRDGVIFCKDHSSNTIRLQDLMSRLLPHTQSPPSIIIGRSGKPMPPSSNFSRHFAAHFVEVEVDVETGHIRIVDYLASQDSGTVLNPKVLENQVTGGAIAASGFALVESLVFDEKTGEIKNPNFLDYKVLRTTDFPVAPRVMFCESYDPVGPYGAKGAGEAPIAAPIPAISQAVYNAVGVWLDIPMTPERVLKALGSL